jgi:hypothetical protein
MNTCVQKCNEPTTLNLTNNFVSLGLDGSLLMWNQTSGSLVSNLTNPKLVGSVHPFQSDLLFRSTDFTLIVGSSLGIASISLRSATTTPVFINGSLFTNLLLLPNGNLVTSLLGSSNNNHFINTYNLLSGTLVSKVNNQYNYGVTDMKLLSNGNLATGDWYSSVNIWNSNLTTKLSSVTTSALVIITLGKNLIAVGCWDYSIYIIDTISGQVAYTLTVN